MQGKGNSAGRLLKGAVTVLVLLCTSAVGYRAWMSSHGVASVRVDAGSHTITTPTPTPAPATAAQDAAPTLKAKPPPGHEVEVCGLGTLRTTEDDASDVPLRLSRMLSPLSKRWKEDLTASDDVRTRAAGLFLLSMQVGLDALARATIAQAAQASSPNAGDLVAAEREIAERLASAKSAPNEPRDELVQLAVGSDDPAVHAMALSACGELSRGSERQADGACERVSYGDWTRREPDNAFPWLVIAGKAALAHDTTTANDAYAHAADAKSYKSYDDAATRIALVEIPADAANWQRYTFAEEVVGATSMTPRPTVWLSRRCRDSAATDDIRRQCATIAEVLARDADDLLDLSLAASVGSAAGWPKSRVDSIKGDVRRLMSAMMGYAPGPDGQYSCDGMQRVQAWTEVRSHASELVTARELEARADPAAQTAAARWKDHLEELKRHWEAKAANEAQGEDEGGPPP